MKNGSFAVAVVQRQVVLVQGKPTYHILHQNWALMVIQLHGRTPSETNTSRSPRIFPLEALASSSHSRGSTPHALRLPTFSRFSLLRPLPHPLPHPALAGTLIATPSPTMARSRIFPSFRRRTSTSRAWSARAPLSSLNTLSLSMSDSASSTTTGRGLHRAAPRSGLPSSVVQPLFAPE